MTRSIKRITMVALITGAALAPPAAAKPETPDCIRSWPEVRYRNYGYDHIVHVANDCRVRAYCAVSSDVNPTPIQVVVPAFGQLVVMTARGSAAREFTPRLECRFVTRAHAGR